jgi:hypothetical protein
MSWFSKISPSLLDRVGPPSAAERPTEPPPDQNARLVQSNIRSLQARGFTQEQICAALGLPDPEDNPDPPVTRAPPDAPDHLNHMQADGSAGHGMSVRDLIRRGGA